MFKSLKSTALNKFVDTQTSAFLIRIFAAAFMLYGHGIDKVMKVLSGNLQFPLDPLGLGPEITLILAAFAEGICAFLVLIGSWTRLASLILVVNMSVAVFWVHINQPFGDMEMGLVYLLLFGAIFLLGPGKYSVD